MSSFVLAKFPPSMSILTPSQGTLEHRRSDDGCQSITYVGFLLSIYHKINCLHADTQWQLDMNNGALIAVPIPVEYEEIGMTIQKAVDQAVTEAEENGISKRGKEVTPWLLARVSELTKGSSLESNIALLKNTALVGEYVYPPIRVAA